MGVKSNTNTQGVRLTSTSTDYDHQNHHHNYYDYHHHVLQDNNGTAGSPNSERKSRLLRPLPPLVMIIILIIIIVIVIITTIIIIIIMMEISTNVSLGVNIMIIYNDNQWKSMIIRDNQYNQVRVQQEDGSRGSSLSRETEIREDPPRLKNAPSSLSSSPHHPPRFIIIFKLIITIVINYQW